MKSFALLSTLIFLSNEWNAASALEAVLMDTRTATSDIGWTMAQGSEWQEVSSTHPDGEERRMLMVCQIKSKQKQNNWVRSPYIPVQGAKRVYVEFEFTMRTCDDVPNVASCKETFNLYYYETDRDEATSTFPPWEEGAYVKVDTIAADRRFRRGSAETNFETRDIGPLTKNGIYVALQDTGSCMAVMHVRVYYKYCGPTTRNLAQFPRTISGPSRTSLIEATGTCVGNAYTENGGETTLFCNSDGEWAVPKGQCACGPGFEPNQSRKSCQACGRGLYKPSVGNGACQRCPAYSHSLGYGSTVCDCMFGYFRSSSDDANTPCTKPPSIPKHLQASVNQTKVKLIWDRSLNDGGRDDLTYRVECSRCQSGFTACVSCSSALSYFPSKSGFSLNNVFIQGLSPMSYYKFKVYAVNGVSGVAFQETPDPNYATVKVATLAAGTLRILAAVDIGLFEAGSFRVSWTVLDQFIGMPIQFDVKVTDEKIHEVVMMNTTTKHSYFVTGLDKSHPYAVQVRARSKLGVDPFSGAIITTPWKSEMTPEPWSPPMDKQENESVNTLQLLIAIIAGLLSVLLVLAVVCYCRRRNQKYRKGTKVDLEKFHMFNTNTFLSNGSYPIAQKTYIDPTTYEDPQRAVLDFTKEIEISCVSIESIIGGGEFGEVCRGHLRLLPFKEEKDVAIKTLKIGYSTQQKLDFLGEASIMGQFDHPNVIRLEGVVTRGRPLMIITEYMENGSLDAYLRKHDGELTVIQLVGMLRNIAAGMKYLSEMGYVHRDLAARNILVNDKLICKVSDFGLSRVLENDGDGTYTTSGGKIPIRWTAPEAITYRKFTSASDVWSYGIVMWEVMSYGERPYWGMSNQDVIQAVGNGFRLPAPMDCPQVQHQLMLDCWKKGRNERPRFSQIVLTLDRVLRDPSQLKAVACQNGDSNGRLVISGGSVANMPLQHPEKERLSDLLLETHSASDLRRVTFQRSVADIFSVRRWLDGIGLSDYKDNFARAGISDLNQVLQLRPSDLSKIGITNVTQQNALLDQIYSMKCGTDSHKNDSPQYKDERVTGIPV